MQITTECPQCGKTYEVDEEYDGAEALCESCGCQFVVGRTASGNTSRKRRCGMSTCIVPWIVLFSIQSGGFIVGWLIAKLIDAFVIAFMIDETWIVATIQVLIVLLCTSIASYFAFSRLAVEMIVTRRAQE